MLGQKIINRIGKLFKDDRIVLDGEAAKSKENIEAWNEGIKHRLFIASFNKAENVMEGFLTKKGDNALACQKTLKK